MVFETVPIDHSGTPPNGLLFRRNQPVAPRERSWHKYGFCNSCATFASSGAVWIRPLLRKRTVSHPVISAPQIDVR